MEITEQVEAARIQGWREAADHLRLMLNGGGHGKGLVWGLLDHADDMEGGEAPRSRPCPPLEELYVHAQTMYFPNSDYPVRAIPLTTVISWAAWALPKPGSIPYAGHGPEYMVDLSEGLDESQGT